jgi:hypothetical protein
MVATNVSEYIAATAAAAAATAAARGEMGDTVLGSLINDRSPTTGLYVRQQLLFGQFVNLLVAGQYCET